MDTILPLIGMTGVNGQVTWISIYIPEEDGFLS
jgi:ribosomal protein S28E/S33